jgi:hypothetical protein
MDARDCGLNKLRKVVAADTDRACFWVMVYAEDNDLFKAIFFGVPKNPAFHRSEIYSVRTLNDPNIELLEIRAMAQIEGVGGLITKTRCIFEERLKPEGAMQYSPLD